MSKKGRVMRQLGIPAFTGGLNSVKRGDLIQDLELQESINQEALSAGILSKRKDVDALGETIPAAVVDIIDSFYIWYPTTLPDGATSEKKYVMLIYDTGGNLWLLHYESASGWVNSLGAGGTNKVFEGLELPVICTTNYGIAIVDGRDGHIAKFIEIDNDGKIIYGDIGLPNAISFGNVSGASNKNEYVDDDALDKGMNVRRGSLLFYCVTQVTEDGIESNPTPIVLYTDLNYLFKDEDYNLERVWKKAVLEKIRSIIADSSDYEGLRERLEYFKIYRADCPYTESSTARGNLCLVGRIAIGDIDGDNSFIDTEPKDVNEPVSHENDKACKGDDICETGRILFVSNANFRIGLPFAFDYFFKIRLINNNSRNYAGRGFKIRINDTDLVDEDGNQIFTWDGVTTGNVITTSKLPKLRIFDGDLTTPLPVNYFYTNGGTHIDIWVKVPYVEQNNYSDIYLCFADSSAGVGSYYDDWEYGKWLDTRALFAFQKVLEPNRVRNENVLVCSGHEYHPSNSVPNRANGNENGEFSSDSGTGVLWVDKSMEFVFFQELLTLRFLVFNSTGDKNAIKLLPEDNSKITFTDVYPSFPTQGRLNFYFATVIAGVTLGYETIARIYSDANNYIKIEHKVTSSVPFLRYVTKKAGVTYTSGDLNVSDYDAFVIFIQLTWNENQVTLRVFNFKNQQYYHTGGAEPIPVSASSVRCEIFGFNLQYSHESYVSMIECDVNEKVTSEVEFYQFMNFLPYFPEELIGMYEGDTSNTNVTIDAGKEIKYNIPPGEIKWSELGGRVMPDLNHFSANVGFISRIHEAPNYMRDGRYLNCIVIFGEVQRQRFILEGLPEEWAGKANEILISEHLHFGLPRNSKDTVLMIGDTLYWLSGNMFVSENQNGIRVLNHDERGDVRLEIPYVEYNKYIAFYNPVNHQILLHTHVVVLVYPFEVRHSAMDEQLEFRHDDIEINAELRHIA